VSPSFRLTPAEELTFDLTGHYTRQNMRQRAGKCFVSDPGNATVAGLLAANFLFGANNPDLHATCRRDQTADFYDFSASTSGNYELETYGVAGTISVDPGSLWILDDNNFKNITAWNVQSEWDQANDLDSTEAVVLDRTFYTPQDISTISEELTWTSTTTLGDLLPFLPDTIGSGAVYPTLGVFFSWEESDHGEQDNLTIGGGNPLIVPVPDGGGGFLPFDISMSATPARFDQPRIDNESRAAYTQWTLEPLEVLHVTGGVRYTWEEKKLERFEPGAIGSRSETFSKWTPMASASLVAPDSLLDLLHGESAIVYYTYAEGFKSGGFNEVTDVSTGDPIPGFDEEELASHEVGTKFAFLENRVVLNTAFFYNQYEDLQLTVVRVTGDGNGLGSSVANAGKATIKGFEVELVISPIRNLQLNGAIGYLDAEYDEFFDTVPGAPGTMQDRSDEPLFNVPEWSVITGVQYAIGLDGLFSRQGLGTLTPRWDFNYKSERAFHLTRAGYQSGLFDEGAVQLHDFRLSWHSPEERLGVGFWVKNAFDKEYINGAVDLTDFFGTGATRVGAPRTFGVDLMLKYF
jgi:iron complex outermembrane receptor protein